MTDKDKAPDNRRQLEVKARKGDSEAMTHARAMLQPTVQAGVTLQQYCKREYGELEIQGLVDALSEQTEAAFSGNLERGEAMLVAQAHTLDSLFNVLAQRAGLNMSEYLDATERYMRLALKAQSQCRATWETLTTMKNPPMVGYVKQANIANGPQQVNNGTMETDEPTRAREKENPQNELLEEKDGERLDTGTTKETSGTHTAMEAVGKVHRPEDT